MLEEVVGWLLGSFTVHGFLALRSRAGRLPYFLLPRCGENSENSQLPYVLRSSHADKVFLVFTRWDGVYAGWMRQDLVLKASVLRHAGVIIKPELSPDLTKKDGICSLAVDLQTFHATLGYITDFRNTEEVKNG